MAAGFVHWVFDIWMWPALGTSCLPPHDSSLRLQSQVCEKQRVDAPAPVYCTASRCSPRLRDPGLPHLIHSISKRMMMLVSLFWLQACWFISRINPWTLHLWSCSVIQVMVYNVLKESRIKVHWDVCLLKILQHFTDTCFPFLSTEVTYCKKGPLHSRSALHPGIREECFGEKNTLPQRNYLFFLK